MLEALYTNTNYSEIPDYFQVELKSEQDGELDHQLSKSLNLESVKYRNKSSQSKEKKFVLDSINIKNSKLPTYNPLKDSNLRNYFQSATVKRQLNNMSANKSQNHDTSRGQVGQIEFIQQEQKKFLNILEQNQILQKKLVLLLANKEKEAKSEANIKLHNKIPQHNSLEEISYIKGGLPKLENNSNPFNKLGNAPDFMKLSLEKTKKKNLKPITKEAYNRLTGGKRNNNDFGTMMNPQMMMLMMMQMQMNNQKSAEKSEKKQEEKSEKKPEAKSEKKPEEKSEKKPEEKSEKKPEEKKKEGEQKKTEGEQKKTEGEAKNTLNGINNMFTPEFMNQYSMMMKMMGINNPAIRKQPQEIKKNRKSNLYNKNHSSVIGQDSISSFGNAFNPYNSMVLNPYQSMDLNKSQSKSPRRKSLTKSTEKKDVKKVEEIKFDCNGKNTCVDDSKPTEQLKFEEEYKKIQEGKKKKEEEKRKIKTEADRKKKEDMDKKKKELQDSIKYNENEKDRKNAEELKKKGKEFEKKDEKIIEGKKPEEKKIEGKKPEEKKAEEKKNEEKK